MRSGVTRILILVASNWWAILVTHLLVVVHVVRLSANRAGLVLELLLLRKQLAQNGDQVGLHEAGWTAILLAILCEVSSVKGLCFVEQSLLLDLVLVDGERAAIH